MKFKLSEFDWIYNNLIKAGLSPMAANYLNMIILFIIAAAIAYISAFIARKLFLKIFEKVSERTVTKFDDYLLKYRFMWHLAGFAPYIVITLFIPLIFADFPEWIGTAQTITDVLLVLLLLRLGRSFFKAGKDYLKGKDAFKDKPVESFVQVVLIFLYVIGGLAIFSIATGKSVWAFLTAMGAASAILLLVFRDTILGFVASIQVASNDMVRIGDWISMEKYGADGDVVEINLATVKVQNWDKTITTIPTYFLISDSFKNWRGMQEAGGRRIKRAIYIKISTIRHLSPEDIEKMRRIELISDYLATRSAEIEAYNKEHNIDRTFLVNGYNLTNIGVFRKYINEYIIKHPRTHKGLTMMVRQLDPTTKGIPLELYLFSSETSWAIYEDIMSDIFDHLLASVKYFDLDVFEEPASSDFKALSGQPDDYSLHVPNLPMRKS